MRKETVEAASREEAFEMCPWAAEVFEVEGGFMCFESMTDAETWEVQK